MSNTDESPFCHDGNGEEIAFEQGPHGLGAVIPDEDAFGYLHCQDDQPPVPHRPIFNMEEDVAAAVDAAYWLNPPPEKRACETQSSLPYTADDQQCVAVDPITGSEHRVVTVAEAKEILVSEFPTTDAAVQVAREAQNTADTSFIIPLISFEKIYFYPAREWPELGPKWQEILQREGELLLTSVAGLQQIVAEYKKHLKSFAGVGSGLMAMFRGLVLREDLPEPPDYDEFKELQKRVDAELDGRVGPMSIDASELFDAGVEFMRVWKRLEDLDERFRKFRAFIQGGTEWSLATLETAEEVSFLILDVAAQLRYAKQPLQKLSVRLAVALARSSARGAGEAIAGGDFLITALRDFAGPQHPSGAARAPDILADGVVDILKLEKVFGARFRDVAKQIVGFAFDGVLAAAVRKHEKNWEPWDRRDGEFLSQFLLKRFVVRAYDSVVAFLPAATKGSLKEQLASAGLAAGRSLASDLMDCRTIAKEENRPFFDVFVSELPTLLIRMTMSAFFAFLEKVLEKKLPEKYPDYLPAIKKRRSTPRPKKGKSRAQTRKDKIKAAKLARRANRQKKR